MKKIFFLAAFLVTLAATNVKAQSKKQVAVAASVEALRKAMIDGDGKMLARLTAEELSYGHSGGHIDNQKEFIEKIVSGKSDFVNISLSNQSIVIEGKTAIVRHELNAETNDNNKPGKVHLLVLLVWVKDDGHWQLIARQAVKAV